MNKQEKILIVDDSQANIYLISSILEEEAGKNFKTLEALNGESALKILETVTPDLILLDLMMPGMDGFELCKRIKKQEKLLQIPVIFISAANDTSFKLEGLKLGAVDYITKPFNRDELMARIDTHLSLREKELKLKEANKTLLEYQNQLEEKVNQRTLELSNSNEKLKKLNQELNEQKIELENTIVKLNNLHAQLVKSDKMASLGVLVAGIAHEINNPVNYTYASLEGLKKNLKFVKEFVDLFENISTENCDTAREQIKEFEAKIKFSQLYKMLEKSVDIIEVGVERTTKIVKSLKTFARTDEKELRQFDVNQNISNTLIILQNLHKNRIKIITDYQEIPKINCFPGQINQVFMNILSNAMDAIKGEGTIKIKTKEVEDCCISISIEDNGEGIPKKILNQIFEPFYTTKEVGKGTGMGLSISHGIVQAHEGIITVESEVGKGSKFEITLPINFSQSKKKNQ